MASGNVDRIRGLLKWIISAAAFGSVGLRLHLNCTQLLQAALDETTADHAYSRGTRPKSDNVVTVNSLMREPPLLKVAQGGAK